MNISSRKTLRLIPVFLSFIYLFIMHLCTCPSSRYTHTRFSLPTFFSSSSVAHNYYLNFPKIAGLISLNETVYLSDWYLLDLHFYLTCNSFPWFFQNVHLRNFIFWHDFTFRKTVFVDIVIIWKLVGSSAQSLLSCFTKDMEKMDFVLFLLRHISLLWQRFSTLSYVIISNIFSNLL